MAGRRRSKSGGSSDFATGILILFVIGVVITYWKIILLVLLIIGMGVLIYSLIKYVVSTPTTQNLVNKGPDIHINPQKPALPTQPALPPGLTAKRFNQPAETVAHRPVEVPVPISTFMTPEEMEAELSRLEAIVRK